MLNYEYAVLYSQRNYAVLLLEWLIEKLEFKTFDA